VGIDDLDNPHEARTVISRPSRNDFPDIRFGYERDEYLAVGIT
jgi:hypothetical protein